MIVKTASIISVGDELLAGRADFNTPWLADRLLEVGLPVVSGQIAGDRAELVAEACRRAASDADVVILTGGLGPTGDDVTRQGLAGFLGRPLKRDEKTLNRLKEFFRRRNREMPTANEIQACVPEGARVLDNDLGTAAGILAEKEGRVFVSLPGVPAEMKKMFTEQVAPILRQRAGQQVVAVRKLRCFGTSESELAAVLGNMMNRGRNPLVNVTVSSGVITVSLYASASDRVRTDEMVKRDEDLLRNMLGDLVFGTGEQTLAEVVGGKLVEQGKTIAVAESCTGGLVGKLLTDVPGASRYFTCGWVTYSNEAKVRQLGITEDLIAGRGAVSEEVARAMAGAAREKAGADISVSLTGVAGPGGGTEQKPVGTVYIAVGSSSGGQAERFFFPGDRSSIRLRAANTALNMVRLSLEV